MEVGLYFSDIISDIHMEIYKISTGLKLVELYNIFYVNCYVSLSCATYMPADTKKTRTHSSQIFCKLGAFYIFLMIEHHLKPYPKASIT